MSNTTKGIYYPASSQIPDVPADMLLLAQSVDDRTPYAKGIYIATSESRTNTAYGLLTTPDRVQNVVVPALAQVEVSYQAISQRSASAGDARVAIFIGSNQLQKSGNASNGGGVQEATMNTSTTNNTDQILASSTGGLFASDSIGGGAPVTAVTTGLVIGGGEKANLEATSGPQYGPCRLFVAAGTYDISIQYKVSSGSVTAKERRLWVRVLPFAN